MTEVYTSRITPNPTLEQLVLDLAKEKWGIVASLHYQYRNDRHIYDLIDPSNDRVIVWNMALTREVGLAGLCYEIGAASVDLCWDVERTKERTTPSQGD